MAKNRSRRGPEFIRFFRPVIDALKEKNASARPTEVYDWIIANQKIAETELSKTNKNGQSNFENKVAFARFYLVKAGYIDGSTRGVWALTDKGRASSIDEAQALEIFKEIHKNWSNRADDVEDAETDLTPPDADNPIAPEKDETGDYLNETTVRENLADALLRMTPTGFEEFCARVFRTLGFDNVTTTGGSGDGGIDGFGELLLGHFFRSRVAFQCKKYQDSNLISSDKIRDFRGAISGRVDRGIFITTSRFTRAASEEARRENTIPVELVDLDKLIDILIREKIGVEERVSLKFNGTFFEQYAR